MPPFSFLKSHIMDKVMEPNPNLHQDLSVQYWRIDKKGIINDPELVILAIAILK